MKPRRYPKPNATGKTAIARTEAYYRMMMAQMHTLERNDALRKAAAGNPVDKEAEAERIAIQADKP